MEIVSWFHAKVEKLAITLENLNFGNPEMRHLVPTGERLRRAPRCSGTTPRRGGASSDTARSTAITDTEGGRSDWRFRTMLSITFENSIPFWPRKNEYRALI